jgi:dolichol kinase
LHAEIGRKAIHLAFIVFPLLLLHNWLPWPRTRGQWTVLLVALVLAAMAIDLVRIHQRQVRAFFKRFFGDMIRRHEQTALLGSTYLLLATLLAVDLFPRPRAAAARGITVRGGTFAAIVGRAYGRTRLFGKSLEGAIGGLTGCLLWSSYLVWVGAVSWPVALTGALVASLAEFLPIPLDDNLGITLFSGYAMRLVAGPL